MVNSAENRIRKPSVNSSWDSLHSICASALHKGMNPVFLPGMSNYKNLGLWLNHRRYFLSDLS